MYADPSTILDSNEMDKWINKQTNKLSKRSRSACSPRIILKRGPMRNTFNIKWYIHFKRNAISLVLRVDFNHVMYYGPSQRKLKKIRYLYPFRQTTTTNGLVTRKQIRLFTKFRFSATRMQMEKKTNTASNKSKQITCEPPTQTSNQNKYVYDFVVMAVLDAMNT